MAREHKGRAAIQHHLVSPGCGRMPETPDRCMEIGLGKDGSFDCSGLIINAMSKVFGRSVDDWPPALRHTRQEVWAMEEVGEIGKPLAEVEKDDVGDLIFSLGLREGKWRAFHVGILSDFGDDGTPIRLESAGNEGSVMECPPSAVKPGVERYVYSSSTLAGLAIASALPARLLTVSSD